MNALTTIANRAVRRIDAMFPGFFPTSKHDHYADFGFPKHIDFRLVYEAYMRKGVAHSAVSKTILKTWQDHPWLLETDSDHTETKLEKDVRARFQQIRLWQRLEDVDRMAMVGGYAALILRFADGKTFDQPVDRVPGGLMGLVEVIPAWKGQLEPEWDEDQNSETYGHPKRFQFKEAMIGNQKRGREFAIHPDRIIIWSKDGTVHPASVLEPGYNDLITMEKISGAGGEGFWKNAKSAPVFEMDKEAQIDQMARAMNVNVEDLVDKMNEQVEDWQKGFDKLLMLQGMQAKTLNVSLPSPEHFFGIALQSFAASINIPVKILVGSQTGERASTEDAEEWAKTNMARRRNQSVPNIMTLVDRLKTFGILAEKDWHLDWTDLTETSMSEKIERADKMAGVNQKTPGEVVFTADEIRATIDMEPLTDAQRYRDDPEDEEAAVTPPVPAEPE